MRVLLVNDYSINGGYGAEAYVRRLAAGLTAAGDEVDVWAGEVRHTGIGRWRDVWDARARKALIARIRKHQPEVVHFHNIARECSGSVLDIAPVAAVMTIHDWRLLGVADRRRRGPFGAVDAAGSRLSGAVAARSARGNLLATMAVSEGIADAAKRAGFPAVSVVGVPVDPPAVEPRPVAECHDIVFAGRLSPDKGPDIAVAAFERVARDHPSARLVMAGDGPMRAAIADFAKPLGDRVQLLGRVDAATVSTVIGRGRFVVVPSVPARRPEGSPTIVAEAAAHGRPVLVSDDRGLRSAATRLGGAVVTPALDVDALAAAMGELLADDQRVRTLGAAARAAVEQFHATDRVVAMVRDLYAAAVAAARPS